MKSFLKTLTIITLLVLQTRAGPCGELNLGDCLTQIQVEILKCFTDLPGENYVVDGNGNITGTVVNIFADAGANFPITIASLKFIVENLPSVAVQQQQVQATIEKLYKEANISYQLSRLPATSASEYHNICHGLQVMLYSGIIYHEVFTNEKIDEALYTLNTHAAILYAGLMHDSAHPGYGNTIYSLSDDKKEALYLTLMTSLERKAVHGGHDLREVGHITSLRQELNAQKAGNQGGAFQLESIHASVAKWIYRVVFTSDLSDMAATRLHSSIMHTNMAHKPEAFSVIEDALGEVILENIPGFTERFEGYNLLTSHGIVHLADISANLYTNRPLIELIIQDVFDEFLSEITVLKADAVDGYMDSNLYGTACGNPYNDIYRSQTGFTHFIIAVLKEQTIVTRDTLTKLHEKLETRIGELDGLILEDDGVALSQEREAKVELLEKIRAMLANLGETPPLYTDFPVLVHLVNSGLANIINFDGNNMVGEVYMPFEKETYDTQCDRHDRRIVIL